MASGAGDSVGSIGPEKRHFSTGEAARVCGLSQQTIIRCFDAGRLTGYRVPGSKFRRIPRDELVRFMRDNGLPTTALDSTLARALVIDHEGSTRLVSALERAKPLETLVEHSLFAGLLRLERERPPLVLLDAVHMPRGVPDFIAALQRDAYLRATIVVTVGGDVAAFAASGVAAALPGEADGRMIAAQVAMLLTHLGVKPW